MSMTVDEKLDWIYEQLQNTEGPVSVFLKDIGVNVGWNPVQEMYRVTENKQLMAASSDWNWIADYLRGYF